MAVHVELAEMLPSSSFDDDFDGVLLSFTVTLPVVLALGMGLVTGGLEGPRRSFMSSPRGLLNDRGGREGTLVMFAAPEATKVSVT